MSENRTMRAALIQMDCVFGDVEKNLLHAVTMIEEAAGKGANIICLPECFNTGYAVDRVEEMASLAETLSGKTIGFMGETARRLGCYLIAPMILQIGNGIAENAAVLLGDQGEVLGVYAKNHLSGGEKHYLRRGYGYPVFETKYGNIGIIICYDMAHPETARILAEKGAEVIFVPSAWRDMRKFMHGFRTNIVCRAIDNVVFMAGANRCGEIGGVAFGGCSQFVDPEGIILEHGGNAEGVVVSTLDLEKIRRERLVNGVLNDSDPCDFSCLAELCRRGK